MDTVNACMDKLTPWLEIAQGGEVTFSQAAVNGFIGGSVGVVGTVISTMIKKEEVKDRLKCVYCDGSGQILCGHCLGLRYVRGTDAQGAPINVKCPNCEGTGTVVCINCQGSGMSVPEDFFQVMGDPEVCGGGEACQPHGCCTTAIVHDCGCAFRCPPRRLNVRLANLAPERSLGWEQSLQAGCMPTDTSIADVCPPVIAFSWDRPGPLPFNPSPPSSTDDHWRAWLAPSGGVHGGGLHWAI